MPKKAKPAATPESAPQQQPPDTGLSRARKTTPIQPEIGLEIENCKKRISSLKALNKLTPVIDQMDKDALVALEKIVTSRLGLIAGE